MRTCACMVTGCRSVIFFSALGLCFLSHFTLVQTSGSCGDPYLVAKNVMDNSAIVNFVKDPCAHEDSTADSSERDFVIEIEAHCCAERYVSVTTSGAEAHRTLVYTECPASYYSSSRVTYDYDSANSDGTYSTAVNFQAAAVTSYYVVIESYNYYDCGNITTELSARTTASYPFPPPLPPSPPPLPPPPPPSPPPPNPPPPPSPFPPPPGQPGTCDSPYYIDAHRLENSGTVNFVKDPCLHPDSTARSGYKDVVIKIGAHCCADRFVTVSTSGTDGHYTYVYTRCPASGPTNRVAIDSDSSGSYYGTSVSFIADAGSDYFAVVENYFSSSCGNVTTTFTSRPPPSPSPPPLPSPPPSPPPPPAPPGSCGNPYFVGKNAMDNSATVSFVKDPCAHQDTTAYPGEREFVIEIEAHCCAVRDVSVATSGPETHYTHVYTECPARYSSSRITYDYDYCSYYCSIFRTSVNFRAAAGTTYYVVIESYDYSDCGDITTELSARTTASFPFPPPPSPPPRPPPSPPPSPLPPPPPIPPPSPPPPPLIVDVGSCSDPLVISQLDLKDGKAVSFTRDLCRYADSTAYSGRLDFVFQIEADCCSTRIIRVRASRAKAVLSAYTECPAASNSDSQVALDDQFSFDTRYGYYHNQIEFEASAGTSYYVALEAVSVSECGIADVRVSADAGSCAEPHVISPADLADGAAVTVTRNPCLFEDSAATSKSDYVLKIEADCCTYRYIRVRAYGIDTTLSVFSECPQGSSSRVAYDGYASGDYNDVFFYISAGTSLFVVVEAEYQPDDCGYAHIRVSGTIQRSYPFPPPPEPPSPPPPSPPPPSPAPPPSPPSPPPPPFPPPLIVDAGSCSDPHFITPAELAGGKAVTFTRTPCLYANSTASSSRRDYVVEIGADCCNNRPIQLRAAGIASILYVFTECPAGKDSASQVVFKDQASFYARFDYYYNQLQFDAAAGASYYLVIEAEDSADCGDVEIRISADAGSCTEPHVISSLEVMDGNSVALIRDPCLFANSTATSSGDYVVKIEGDCCSTRLITIKAYGIDSALSVFTECPAVPGAASQVVFDDSRLYSTEYDEYYNIVDFQAAAGTSYYVSLEADSEPSNCGVTHLQITGILLDAFPFPPPFPLSPSPPPPPPHSIVLVRDAGVSTGLQFFGHCPSSSTITRISGRAQLLLDTVNELGCSDGTTISGLPSESGGSEFTLECTSGFSGMQAPADESGNYISDPAWLCDGTWSSWGGDTVTNLSSPQQCPDGLKLTGMGIAYSSADRYNSYYPYDDTSSSQLVSYLSFFCEPTPPPSPPPLPPSPGPPPTPPPSPAPPTSPHPPPSPPPHPSPPPASPGSCGNPYFVGKNAMDDSATVSFVKDPCAHEDNIARPGKKEFVIEIEAHCCAERDISVSTSGADGHRTVVYTECPASYYSSSRVAYDSDSCCSIFETAVNFQAAAGMTYYIVVESYYSNDCGDITTELSARKTAQYPFPPPPSPPPPLPPSPSPPQSPPPSPQPPPSPPPSPNPPPNPPPPPTPPPSPFPPPPPPAPPGSCGNPYFVGKNAMDNSASVSFMKDPCAHQDVTARSGRKEFVIEIEAHCCAERDVSLTTSGADGHYTFVYTECPANFYSTSRVAYDSDGCCSIFDTAVNFRAAAGATYYVVVESYYSNDCGDITTELSARKTAQYPLPPPPPSPLPPRSPLPSPSPPPSPRPPPSPLPPSPLPPSPSPSPRPPPAPPPSPAPPSPSPPPAPTDSCSNPHIISPSDLEGGKAVSFARNPCIYTDSTATASRNDYVIKIEAHCCESRSIRVRASGGKTRLSAFTDCPASRGNASQVALEDQSTFYERLDYHYNQLEFDAIAGTSYFLALEADRDEDCGDIDIRISADDGSCTEPHVIAPFELVDGKTVVLTVNPCSFPDSTSGPQGDYVVMIEADCCTTRIIRVDSYGITGALSAFTECPAARGSPSQVAFDSRWDDKWDYINFTATAGSRYFVVLEADNVPTDCGVAHIHLSSELPPPPPPLPLSPSPPPPPPLARLPASLDSQRTGKTSLLVQAKIDADLAEVSETPESVAAFKDDVCHAFATNLHRLEPEKMEMDGKPCFACVTAGQLSPGSIIVPITVVLKDSESSTSMEDFADKVDTTSTQQLFKGSAYESKVTEVTIADPTSTRFASPPPVPVTSPISSSPVTSSSGSSGIDPTVVGPAVAVPVAVIAALAVALLVVLNNRRQPVSPTPKPEPTPPPEPTPQPASGSGFEPIHRDLLEECGELSGADAGGFGIVIKGTYRPEGQQEHQVVLKSYKLSNATTEAFRSQFFHEVLFSIQRSRQCPHRVVFCHGWSTLRSDQVCLVMKYYQRGSLLQYINDHDEFDPIPPRTILRLAAEIAQGLAELHNLGDVYDDLKPDNVLIDDDGGAVLADFGLAKSLKGQRNNLSATSAGGTFTHMPPEKFFTARPGARLVWGQPADIWAFGITLAQLASSDMFAPWGRGFGIGSIMQMMQRREIPQIPASPEIPSLKPLIERCLNYDPDARPTAPSIVVELRGMTSP